MGSAYQIHDQQQSYFLTFLIVGWTDVFTRKVYRDLILESLTHCRKNMGLEVFAYVIMSNHMHVIFRSKTGELSKTIGSFKRHTSKKIMHEIASNPVESRKTWLEMMFKYHAKFNKRVNDVQFWTHDNHAVELFDHNIFKSRLEYIHNNPVKAGWVDTPEHYLYSSARNYADEDALIEIDLAF